MNQPSDVDKATAADIEVPVPIADGGGARLACSMLLSQLGIRSPLLSVIGWRGIGAAQPQSSELAAALESNPGCRVQETGTQ